VAADDFRGPRKPYMRSAPRFQAVIVPVKIGLK